MTNPIPLADPYGPCPSCAAPEDADHYEGCVRIGTCGQYTPWLDSPFHAEHPPLPGLLEMQRTGSITRAEWEKDYADPWRRGLAEHRKTHDD